MSVRCEGDFRVMEQIGERQDFEAELSRLGLRHEDFELYVRRANFNGAKNQWSSNYAVRVSNLTTTRRNIYWAGPGQDWVAQFTTDVLRGLYGEVVTAYKRPTLVPYRSSRHPVP